MDIKHRQFAWVENVGTSVAYILCYEKKISFTLGKTTKQRDKATEQVPFNLAAQNSTTFLPLPDIPFLVLLLLSFLPTLFLYLL